MTLFQMNVCLKYNGGFRHCQQWRSLQLNVATSKCVPFLVHLSFAYGTVSHLRFTARDRDFHCSFLMSKTLSVPCLELIAATLTVKLDRMFCRELEVPISHSVFWTHTMSLLRFILNKNRHFQHVFLKEAHSNP